MLGVCREDVAARGGSRSGYTQESQVVAFGSAACEKHLFRFAASHISDLAPGMIDSSFALVVKKLRKAERQALEIRHGKDAIYG